MMNQKAKILVVEDEMAVAMMMVYLLTQAGFDVQTATIADKALRMVQSANFDLITLDIDLVQSCGFEVLNRMKQSPLWRDTPVVFVSGRSRAEDRERAAALGAVDFIEKPFGTELASRISRHVKSGQMRDCSQEESCFQEHEERGI